MAGVHAKVDVVIDAGEYVVNAMPPGPPAVPAAQVRVIATRGGLPGESESDLVAVIRSQDGTELLRVPLQRRNVRRYVEGMTVAAESILLVDDHGRPLPDGSYVVEVVGSRRPEPVGMAAFRLVTAQ